ncbi:MAG: rhomboid family intramembrane serine protease [Flavobacteriales bacterium]|nr:rhomboid family intramembrane serine protease [Flavobacteriales bacterium]
MGTPYITYGLLIITVLTSYRAFSDQGLLNKMVFNATAVKHHKQWYRLISHGFIHGSTVHLIFNMLGLYFFGPTLEMFFTMQFGTPIGNVVFLLMYICALVVGSIPSLIKHGDNPNYNSLGASGAVYAIILAFALLWPVEKVYLFGIIGLPAYLMGILFFVSEKYLADRGGTNIGHDAHLAGAAFGILFVLLIEPSSLLHFVEQIMAHPFGRRH